MPVNNEDITRRAPEQDVVVFSRVRLARNYADTPFSPKMEAEQAGQMIQRVREVIAQGPEAEQYQCLLMRELREAQRNQLVEHHLISYDLLKYADWSATFISSGETVSVMVNEEDHLRIQGMLRGLQLERAAELAFHMEERLSVQEEFAFDAQWGYLTSCPTNTGTGMRACAVVHLPALSASEQINPLAQAAARLGMTVRGLYGEGSDAKSHHLYMISNQETLGRSEEDIIRSLIVTTQQIAASERAARTRMMSDQGATMLDRLMRTLGIVKYARIMRLDEMLPRLSDARLAAALGLLDYPLTGLDNLICDLQDGSLSARAGREMASVELNALRADILRDAFRDVEP